MENKSIAAIMDLVVSVAYRIGYREGKSGYPEITEDQRKLLTEVILSTLIVAINKQK